jgi:uncharacterized protein (DUF302 family)
MEDTGSYAFSIDLDLPFEDAVSRVTEALKGEGFGVLTEIDVKAVLKKKLGVDFRSYIILGACNPPFAHRALEADLDVGLLLPCNVVLYERDDGKVHAAAINPASALGVIQSDRLREIAGEVSTKLKRAITRSSEDR